MSEKKPPSISENPTPREMSEVLPLIRVAKGITGFLKRIGISGERIDSINKAAETALSQADILTLPDRFNTAFADKGWIATNSFSADVMRKSLEHFGHGDTEAAEACIMDWFTEDTVRLFAITRSKRFNVAEDRWFQLNEAWELTKEERYYAAVPLILIVADGLASDVIGSSPFEKGADLTLFDSIVGHSTALPSLIGRITKGVRKSSDDPIDLPFRHGILHGRSLGYANRKVCLKAWMLHLALVDWASDKQEEEARKAKQEGKGKQTWSEVVERQKKAKDDKAAIEAFESIDWLPPLEPEEDKNGPVFAFHDFLAAWKAKNYGGMATRAVNLTGMKVGYLAGRLRQDGALVELTEFEVQSVRQSNVCRADAVVAMKGKTLKGTVEGLFSIAAFRNTAEGDIAMPTDHGTWQVQQGCMFSLMHERTLKKK